MTGTHEYLIEVLAGTVEPNPGLWAPDLGADNVRVRSGALSLLNDERIGWTLRPVWNNSFLAEHERHTETTITHPYRGVWIRGSRSRQQ